MSVLISNVNIVAVVQREINDLPTAPYITGSNVPKRAWPSCLRGNAGGEPTLVDWSLWGLIAF